MKAQKIIVLQGVPACGKSTWAKDFIKGKEKEWVIVCRDSIRNGCSCSYGMNVEDYISAIEKSMVETALRQKLSVVIDATNLNSKTINKWKSLAENQNVEIEFKKFTISFDEAVKRDEQRKIAGDHYVGKEVIKKFFKNYFPDEYSKIMMKTIDYKRLLIDTTKPAAVICDLDGTLAWMQNRSPFDYDKAIDDKCDIRLRQLLINIASKGIKLLFVTGREDTGKAKETAIEWINNNFFKDYELFMRQEKDHRKDEAVKKEIYDYQIKDNYDIIAVFEDRDRVVEMWRNEGLLCCQVEKGDF